MPLSLNDCRSLLQGGPSPRIKQIWDSIEFADHQTALDCLRGLAVNPREQESLAHSVPALIDALVEAPDPDRSLRNLHRLIQSLDDRQAFFVSLIQQPRKIEILVKFFVGSQFLSEILVRHPNILDRLTQHKQLAEFKGREQFLQEARSTLRDSTTFLESINQLRRHQRWEILRIAACDQFNLLNLKSVTLQLSLLADAMVQCCLDLVAGDLGVPADSFVVLAFGKLGGEELNYSSDIDLVFVVDSSAEQYWRLGQRLIHALNQSTEAGFLYRVDMRLRPWGQSGPLVVTAESYERYLRDHAAAWEKQAFLKARPIAGATELGWDFLDRARPLIFSTPRDELRKSLSEMKRRMESRSRSGGTEGRSIKTGPGGIRDIEFLTQYLQLIHGANQADIRTPNTLEGLIRLADHELIMPGEYRHLTQAYLFQRTVEHALQLMHNQQEHDLPASERGQAYLARKLDFLDTRSFLDAYRGHRRAVRRIYQAYLEEDPADRPKEKSSTDVAAPGAAPSFDSDWYPFETIPVFDDQEPLLKRLSDEQPVAVHSEPAGPGRWLLTVAGYDLLGDLSLICGLLWVYGLDIESGSVVTETSSKGGLSEQAPAGYVPKRRFVNRLLLKTSGEDLSPVVWERYEQELRELFGLASSGSLTDAQGRLARRVALSLERKTTDLLPMKPVEILVDNDTREDSTILRIRSDNVSGFFYELTNALAISGIDIQWAELNAQGGDVSDTLAVTAQDGSKISQWDQIHELRAAVVLIKHLTHLLPHAPDPESALLHFRELLEYLFRQDHWLEELSSLHQPDVLQALARLLGGSQFLWEDFLRLQHDNLFPVLTDVAALDVQKDRETLSRSLAGELAGVSTVAERQRVLNAFKDREMFRIDMRHILGRQHQFGMFSQELTWLAETIVEAALSICFEQLTRSFGVPQAGPGMECPFVVCGLGKFGGRELGFASDIELLFLYDCEGETEGQTSISNQEFFSRLVENFQKMIQAKQRGIFEIDLRLRPYGRSGNLAVSLETFESYFGSSGPAWPYERQALVKLRPVAGNEAFGERVLEVRDRCIYTPAAFDIRAMRGMRERQLNELIKGGRLNAKLSLGGLVDCEYFVQALQITFGDRFPQLRKPNTRDALRELEAVGILEDRIPLRDAYRFLRRVIDALRMVRGDARDLTIPPYDSEEFQFLARRLGYHARGIELQSELEHHMAVVMEHQRQLESLINQAHERMSKPL